MSEMYTLDLAGQIVLESPYATSPPGCQEKVKEGLILRLPKMPFYENDVWTMRPYMPAAGWKGRVRRAAARLVIDRFLAAGEPIGRDEWLWWRVGGVKGNEKGAGDPGRRREALDSCALLKVFGAGESPGGGFAAGCIAVANGVPATPDISLMRPDPEAPRRRVSAASLITGARAHDTQHPDMALFLSPEAMAENLEIIKAQNEAYRKRKEEEEKKRKEAEKKRKAKGKESPEVTDAIAAALAEINAEEGSDEEVATPENALGRTLAGYEVIPQGMRLRHRVTLAGVSKLEIGFFMATLREFSTCGPVIGSHVANGCGLISASYDAKVRVNGRGAWDRKADSVQISADEMDLALGSPFLQECEAIWNESSIDFSAYRAPKKKNPAVKK